MIVLLLLAAVAAGAYWAGTQTRPHPRNDVPQHPAVGTSGSTPRRMSAPSWAWVLGVVVLVVMVLGFGMGPGGMLDGPGLLGGPGGMFGPMFGP
ncbi:hypothetical protein [Mycobacterium vicinigordonae]|uniref:Uncharacterized protein n=1 Tax=Mycobacterium vicinigordonae TaxID=1719132 RepID=A0A7D6E463_9MYCO|nr:hypothetical protein [Mycobacterium vicinigordonae]QLL06862.1 hypothetical protein H0P51_24710 [Mycobacterium vicinigordonae]